MKNVIYIEDFRAKSLPGQAESLSDAAKRLLDELNRRKIASDLAKRPSTAKPLPCEIASRRIPEAEQGDEVGPRFSVTYR